MKTSSTIRAALRLGLLAALLATCTAGSAPPATATSTIEDTRAAAPATLTLSGTEADGALLLHARIDVTGGLPRTARLIVEVPAASRLAEGVADEALPELTRGAAIERTWRIEGFVAPVHVTLRATDGTAGVTLRASWPASLPAPVVVPRPAPMREIRIFGIPIRSSIPVGPLPTPPATPAGEGTAR